MREMETKNVMIVGVGGQGSLLASKLLGNLLMEQGYDVKVSEVHGMSQRGGSVVTYVRYGDKVYSPVIDKGEADFIISFELLEAARWAEFLRPGGRIIVNTQQIDPMPVITGAASYPSDIIAKLRSLGLQVDAVDALEIAEQADDSLIITAVHKNSAADKAGVQKGDVITALDGSETDYSAVAGRLSSGEKAMITVKRGEESIAFELSASTYTATTVESRLINTTGYIRIRSFYSNTPEQFKAAMTALEEQGAQNFVFDLRNNEGGTLTAVSDILGYLLPRGTYARRVETAGAVSDLTSEGTHELSQSSVTLVNETTAGEAELFAGVLQEFKKTTVVGMSTKGRGKIQAFYNVTSDGSAIKVSIASLSLLEGGEIEGKGVTPDQTVALTADQESRFEFLTEEDDPQLKTALSVLNNTIVTPPTTTTTGSGASTTTTVQPAS